MTVNGKCWSAANIRKNIRRGYTIDLFIKEYGFADETELYSYICKIYKHGTKEANKILREIQGNSNNAKRKSNPELEKFSTAVPSTEMVMPYATKVSEPITEELNYQQVMVTGDIISTQEIESSQKTESAKEIHKAPQKTANTSKETKKTQSHKPSKENSYGVAQQKTQDNLKTENILLRCSTSISRNKKEQEDPEDLAKKISEDIKSQNANLSALVDVRTKLIRNTKKLNEEMETFFQKVQALLEELKHNQEMCVSLEKKVNENNEKLEKNKEQIIAVKMQIKSLEEELQKVQVVKIYCGKDASMANFEYNVNNVDVAPEKVFQRAVSLQENDSAGLLDDFSLKEIKWIAKVMIVFETVEEGTDAKNVELVIEEKYKNLKAILELLNKKVNVI